MKTTYGLLLSMLLLLASPLQAAPDAVYSHSVKMSMDEAYGAVYAGLEENRFWVVFEANMGQRMAGMAERFGDDYNRQGLSGIKSMVFCNIGWTNKLASVAPELLALCPLHMTLYEKDGETTVVFPRPAAIAAGSVGIDAARELEQQLIGIVEKALSGE